MLPIQCRGTEIRPALYLASRTAGSSRGYAGFSRVYSQIDSYAARSLHLSGPQGEHLKLASFAQSVRSANRHIEEVAELRKRIASALHIVDGGEA